MQIGRYCCEVGLCTDRTGEMSNIYCLTLYYKARCIYIIIILFVRLFVCHTHELVKIAKLIIKLFLTGIVLQVFFC